MKKIAIALGLILLVAASVAYYVFVYSVNNHRGINKEHSVIVSSGELIQSFEQTFHLQY